MSPISVTFCQGARPCQKTLPETLLRRRMLKRLIRLSPVLEIFEPGETGTLDSVRRFGVSQFANRSLWPAWRRLPGMRHSGRPAAANAWLADQLIARSIPQSDIFHGCTAASLSSLGAAKRQGAVTLIENPMLHPQHWQNAVEEECRRFGVNLQDCAAGLQPSLLRRQHREYELCNRIVVPSQAARQSFAEYSYAHKVEVVPSGVDHTFFTPPPADARPRVFRACYVGRIELVKGLGYLLQAWKRLGLRHAELMLIGEVRPEMNALLKEYATDNVTLLGTVSTQQLAEHYRDSSVFVMPSVNEGLAQVILEAMASGLPVIATEKSGAAECVTEGGNGLIVPARDVDALAEAIQWSYQHQDELTPMGQAARAAIENRFTIAHYEKRLMNLWQSLAVVQRFRQSELARS